MHGQRSWGLVVTVVAGLCCVACGDDDANALPADASTQIDSGAPDADGSIDDVDGGPGGASGVGGTGGAGAGGTGGASGTGGTGTGPYSLAVAEPGLYAEVTLDSARAVTARVPRTGGTLEATATDGTVYTLVVPNNALDAETTITMTPIATLNVPDLPAERSVGVVLGPNGQQFINPVTLRITPPQGTTWPVEEQLPIAWNDDTRRVYMTAIERTEEVRFSVMHFTGFALLLARKGVNATLEPARHRLGGDATERLRSIAAERLGVERQRALLGFEGEDFPGFEDLRSEYVQSVLNPRLAAAADSCANGRLALETLFGFEREAQLLGLPTDAHYGGMTFNALVETAVAQTATVCMREEYELCRDEHILTRIIPVFLGLARQAQLLGFAGADASGYPQWLNEAEDRVRQCLKFELQFDSSVSYAGTEYPTHTMSERVTSRVAIDYGLAFTEPLPDSPMPIRDFEGIISGNLQPMTASNLNIAYTEDCSRLNSQMLKHGQLGVSFLVFTAGTGSVSNRAMVTDFGISIAIATNLSEHNYTFGSRVDGTCEDAASLTTVESWGTTAGSLLLSRYLTADGGAYINGWQVTQGSDIPATKNISFTARTDDDQGNATVNADLVLFHTPTP